MLRLIDLLTPVRVTETAEAGLDEAMHGETAYAFDADDQKIEIPTLVK
jgi:ammonia channel protein AmtB